MATSIFRIRRSQVARLPTSFDFQVGIPLFVSKDGCLTTISPEVDDYFKYFVGTVIDHSPTEVIFQTNNIEKIKDIMEKEEEIYTKEINNFKELKKTKNKLKFINRH